MNLRDHIRAQVASLIPNLQVLRSRIADSGRVVEAWQDWLQHHRTGRRLEYDPPGYSPEDKQDPWKVLAHMAAATYYHVVPLTDQGESGAELAEAELVAAQDAFVRLANINEIIPLVLGHDPEFTAGSVVCLEDDGLSDTQRQQRQEELLRRVLELPNPPES